MRQETRFKFNAYLSRVAELNGIDAGDVSKKFTVEPSVTQTLMNTMQESSDFLTRINIVPVSEMKGEKIGIGVTGSIASTTDTAGGTERQPKDFSKLASNKYECDQINFDFYIRYKTLDLWARYQDFQLRVRNAIIKRQSLDLIMAGFNGVRRAETSDRSSNHRDKTTEQHAPDKQTRGDGFTTGKHLADNNQHPNHEKRQDAFFFCCHALLPQIDSFSHGRGLNVGQFDGGAVWQHRPQFSQSRICGEHSLDHALSSPVIPDTNGVERVAL